MTPSEERPAVDPVLAELLTLRRCQRCLAERFCTTETPIGRFCQECCLELSAMWVCA